MIKFVISGPFLNAEAAHTQWTAEPPSSSAMQDMIRRITELERKLDEERALVQQLSRQIPEEAAAAPVARRAVEPAPPSEPTTTIAAEPVAAPAPRFTFDTVARQVGEPVAEPDLLTAVQAMAENAARTAAAPAPQVSPLSTVAQTPPPKVRGLRRMIGALRRL